MRIPAPPGFEGRPPREWPIPPMDHSAGWKASAYTPAMARLLLARVAAGETLKQVTADPRMPAYATVYRWTQVHEDFGEAWYRLREELARQAQTRDLQDRANRASRRAFEEAIGLRPRRGPGRPSTYTAAKARAVCERIEDGLALSQVLGEPGMPSAKAVYAWLRRQPKFRRMYVEACRKRLSLLEFERHLAIDSVWDGAADIASANRALAAIEGRMGRTLPKKYRTHL